MASVKYGTTVVEYQIQRKSGLKNTYINVDNDGVLVKTSKSTSLADIEQLVVKKSAWITKHLKTYKAKGLDVEITTGSRLYYLGRTYYVDLTKEEGRTQVEVQFTHSKFHILTPEKYSQLALHSAIDAFYKERAVQKVTPLAKKWAKVMKVQPKHISYRKAEKRWGSCSPTNRISFNYHLMKIPMSLVEYVVVHELSHIEHKSHSKAFWALVKKYLTDYKMKDSKIKQFEKLL